MCALLIKPGDGVQIVDMCGPEKLSGVALALRLARRYKALPIPVWFAGLAFMLKVLKKLGWSPVTPDQLSRLVGPKTASCSSVEFLKASEAVRFQERASV